MSDELEPGWLNVTLRSASLRNSAHKKLESMSIDEIRAWLSPVQATGSEQHYIEVFSNRLGSTKAVICSCGFATTYSILRGDDSDAKGRAFFDERHASRMKQSGEAAVGVPDLSPEAVRRIEYRDFFPAYCEQNRMIAALQARIETLRKSVKEFLLLFGDTREQQEVYAAECIDSCDAKFIASAHAALESTEEAKEEKL